MLMCRLESLKCLRSPDVIRFDFFGYILDPPIAPKQKMKSDLISALQLQRRWRSGEKKLETKVRSNNATLCVCVFRSSQPEISHHRNKTCSFLPLHDCSSMTPQPSPSSQLLLLLLLTQEELLLSCCDS